MGFVRVPLQALHSTENRRPSFWVDGIETCARIPRRAAE